jgi:hypothetical protein
MRRLRDCRVGECRARGLSYGPRHNQVMLWTRNLAGRRLGDPQPSDSTYCAMRARSLASGRRPRPAPRLSIMCPHAQQSAGSDQDRPGKRRLPAPGPRQNELTAQSSFARLAHCPRTRAPGHRPRDLGSARKGIALAGLLHHGSSGRARVVRRSGLGVQ